MPRQPQRPLAERGGARPQIDGPAGHGLPVTGFEVFGQHSPGHAVHGQVVRAEQELWRTRGATLDEDGGELAVLLQTEPGIRPLDPGMYRRVLLRPVQSGQVDAAQHRVVRVRRSGELVPLPVYTGEAAAQRVVLPGQRGDGGRQRGAVGGRVQVEDHVLVEVFRPRFVVVEEPVLNGRQRNVTGGRGPGPRVLPGGAVGDRGGGQRGDGLPQEDVLGVHGQTGGTGPGDDLHAEDGVTAQLEEVVLGADLLHAQDVRPDPGQGLLDRPARCDVLLRARRGVPVGCGQRAAVELAGGGEGEPVDGDEGAGDHVGRQRTAEEVAQHGGFRGVGAGGGDGVGDQPLGTVLHLDGDDGGGREGGVLEQGGTDLAGLDAETADLDLVVDAAEVLQRARGQRTGQVTGAVQTLTGGERRRDEAFGGQVGPPQVPGREARAADPQLTGDARRDRRHPLVQDVHAGVRDRTADRHGGAPDVLRGDAVGGGEDHALDRPVAVDQAQRGVFGQDAGHVRGRGGLAAGDDLFDGAQGRRVLVGHDVEQAGGQPQGGDPVLGDQLGDHLGVGRRARVQDAGGAVQQGAPQLQREGVPGHRGALEPDMARAELGEVLAPYDTYRRPVG